MLAALLRREDKWEGSADVWLLPSHRLPAGHAVRRREQINSSLHLWVHANYVFGKGGKVRRLQQLGLWQPRAACPGLRPDQTERTPSGGHARGAGPRRRSSTAVAHRAPTNTL